jgi:hypothetical protein
LGHGIEFILHRHGERALRARRLPRSGGN